MSLSNTSTHYGGLAKVFHWTTAALILAVIPLGIIANNLPYDTPDQLAFKAQVFTLHKTLGVAVFFVALARILWALGQAKPGALHPERKAETLAAEVVHWLLYGSLVAAPLSGWIHHAATTGFAPIWWPFGQSLPFVPKDEGVAALWGSMHWWLTKLMAASLFLHIAGALKHQFIDRDVTLKRMWFGASDVPTLAYHRAPIAAPVLAALAFFGVGGAAALTAQSHSAPVPEAVALAEVASDWTVTEGTLAITVEQLGSAVEGSFADWTAQISFDPYAGPEFGAVEVTISIGSLSLGSVTGQALSADYFDATSFPTASFSGPITQSDQGGYVVDGTLSLKAASVPVTLPFDLTLEGDTATASGTVTVIRTDFGVGTPEDTNVGPEVEITFDLTAVRGG